MPSYVSHSDQYDLGMEYSGYANLGEFGRVRVGMNVNIWDANEDVQKLVRAGYGGRPVELTRLGDPAVPLSDLID
jgi:3-phenylpropionate/trans-cinnamate dioxygenase ferredoxin reductase component